MIGSDAANELIATADSSTIRGLGGDDRLIGADGADSLEGGEGADYLEGGFGPDVLDGGGGVDQFVGDKTERDVIASGNDQIRARDGLAEQINCGIGSDSAIVDAADVVDPSCEAVDRAAPPVPGGPGPANPAPSSDSLGATARPAGARVPDAAQAHAERALVLAHLSDGVHGARRAAARLAQPRLGPHAAARRAQRHRQGAPDPRRQAARAAPAARDRSSCASASRAPTAERARSRARCGSSADSGARLIGGRLRLQPSTHHCQQRIRDCAGRSGCRAGARSPGRRA